MLEVLKNLLWKERRSTVREPSNWKLSLVNSKYPVEVFLYFSTHEDAKDHEDACTARGWTSLGIVWYDTN